MSKQKGQTLVEFALILPILLLTFFIIIESGRLFHAYITVQHAARMGARYTITGQRDPNCKWWWDGSTPSSDELRVCSIMAVARSQMGALAVDPAAVAWDEPGRLEVCTYALKKEDPSDSSTWHVPDCAPREGKYGYAGEPNEKVTVRVVYRLEIITPLLRPIARSVPVVGQAEMINEAFGQVGGLGFQGARVPPAPFVVPTPGPSPTPCPPITLTIDSLLMEGASQVGVVTGPEMPVTIRDMNVSPPQGQIIGNGTSPAGSNPVSFTVPVSPVLVAGHLIRAQQIAACTDYDEGTVQGQPTPTPTPSLTPTPTDTPEPCHVVINEPLISGATQVIVYGEVGETIVIRDLSQSGAPTLGAATLTGGVGPCAGSATIPVAPLIGGHTIVALGPTSSDWTTVLVGTLTPTTTSTPTHTPTTTPTPTRTGTPTPTVAATPTPRDSYIVFEPTCAPAGAAQSVTVRGYNWPTNKGPIRIRWDGQLPDKDIIDPPLPLWGRTINLSASDTITEGTHFIWAGVDEPPYTYDQKNFLVPCAGTPTLTPTPTPTETATPTPTATPLLADLTIDNFEYSGNQTWVPVTFTVGVDNIGIGGANNPFWVGLFVNPASPPSGGEFGDVWTGVSSLAAGGRITLTLGYVFTATGTYPVYAYADTSQAINETNEGNNAAGPINVVVNVAGNTPTPTATPTETTTPVTPGSIDGTTFVFLGGELKPLGRVNVFLYKGLDLVASTISNDRGYYQFASVEPYSNYTVIGITQIDGTTYSDTRLPVVVQSGQNTTVSLLLLPQ